MANGHVPSQQHAHVLSPRCFSANMSLPSLRAVKVALDPINCPAPKVFSLAQRIWAEKSGLRRSCNHGGPLLRLPSAIPSTPTAPPNHRGTEPPTRPNYQHPPFPTSRLTPRMTLTAEVHRRIYLEARDKQGPVRVQGHQTEAVQIVRHTISKNLAHVQRTQEYLQTKVQVLCPIQSTQKHTPQFLEETPRVFEAPAVPGKPHHAHVMQEVPGASCANGPCQEMKKLIFVRVKRVTKLQADSNQLKSPWGMAKLGYLYKVEASSFWGEESSELPAEIQLGRP